MAFAREWDPQPFHLDEAAAAASIYRGLIASGWHTAAGRHPRARLEVLEVRPSRSRPDRGIMRARAVTPNQHGEEV